ncbi:uncharacterized protein FTOL_07703 [Fusarium torulosum]|uniref:Uncharacterized protein n=1 Tax=Fusarium torulosum TaxID=33205 RepID=A0AAE8SJY3_9HYPO|nr:uncharacterized protein FTOL_07703 [Fusarium torulosum]
MSAGHLFLHVMASLLLVSPLVLFAHFCLFGAFANGSRLDEPFESRYAVKIAEWNLLKIRCNIVDEGK